jgi:sensor histidine kinase YesM
MKNKKYYIKTPVNYILLISALFLSLYTTLLWEIEKSLDFNNFKPFFFTSIGLIFNTCFFSWLFYKLFKFNYSWLIWILFTILFFISYSTLVQIADIGLFKSEYLNTRIYILLFVFINIFFIATGYFHLNRIFEKFYKNRDEVEIKKSELENLKNQLSPHFLFNNLNNIYATIMMDKKIALDYTHKFSDMMRFYHNMIGKETIPLSDELSYIENYLAIEKYKMGERLRLNYVNKIKNMDYTLPPFLLTPVIEAAIERSQGLGSIPYIELVISVESKKLKLEISNSIPDKPGKVKKQILLDQLRYKLELLYNDHYSLTIVKQNNFETSILQLPLTNDEKGLSNLK